jgi:phosphoribosylformylglycinamidine cyclo-ligase
MTDPLLVSSTDGVGTKLLLGIQENRLEGLGIDLVAMCVNDLYTVGATPMFFLDYFATGKLDEAQFKSVLTGIRKGLDAAGCMLLGGETAELPGLYGKSHFDLAGFVVGVVDGKRVLGPNRVNEGDVLYAFPSSGFHSNGYSLIRKWLESSNSGTKEKFTEHVLTPTRIYHEIPQLLEILDYQGINALAHITGGGISGNLPRVIPNTLSCHVSWADIRRPEWMDQLFASQNVTALEMEGIFNCGIGMIASVARTAVSRFESACQELATTTYPIGTVAVRKGEREVIFT